MNAVQGGVDAIEGNTDVLCSMERRGITPFKKKIKSSNALCVCEGEKNTERERERKLFFIIVI